MLKVAALVVALVALGARGQSLAPDHCAQYATCTDCLDHNLCGWCSVPVVYPGNVTGKQCAGFNPDGKDPFACNGIYSTDTCAIGYKCDLNTFQCVKATAGDGLPKAECELNCTNHGQVYKCNHTDKKCYQVPSGTKGAAAHSVCEAECVHPSAHPASPGPTAEVYACNYTTGECHKAKAGQGEAKSVCEAECKKTNGTQYFCNKLLEKCIEVPPSVHGGMSKAKCEEACAVHPHPGPPPYFKGGMWRGIEIQQGYKVGEWDMDITDTAVTIVDVITATTTKGLPFHVTNGDKIELYINVTSGPGAGEVIQAYGEPDSRGPETNYLTAAFTAPGGKLPASINAAMTAGGGVKAFFLAQCVGTPECVFSMPASQTRDRTLRSVLAEVSQDGDGQAVILEDADEDIEERLRLSGVMFNDEAQRIERVADAAAANENDAARRLGELSATVGDRCAKYGANCSYCLDHQFCGWCSTPVTYKDGKKGTQCAGFAQHKNESNPFVCEGRYSTLSCTTGYDCDEKTHQCVPNSKQGNGMPKSLCEKLCRPTPSPTPLPPQYVCNITEKKCHKCDKAHCAGSMPKSTCEAACVKPKPGPTGLVKGIWRGIKIQNHYPLGEYELYFNASDVTFYKNGKRQFKAAVESLGGDVMIFKDDGTGDKYSCLYSIADQGAGLYEVMTLAVAKGDKIPQTFAPPMETSGDYEMVLAKCNAKPCDFQAP